jgi:hypothetical protein
MTFGGGIMKSARSYVTAVSLFLFFLLALSGAGLSQDSDQPPYYTREQLAQMLAPIALYPDALLSQVLMASTYPLEVIEADRWVEKNPLLTSDGLDEALQNKDWDPSVKSLCHFPKVLALMSEKITETTNLGNAFLAQEDEVMVTIQQLRDAAYEQGNLTTGPEQKVIVEKETIYIEAADPEIIYVPYYNPHYVYGTWWYPDFPPYYWDSHFEVGGAGILFWPSPFIGFAIGSWSSFDWHRHSIIIDVHKRPRFFRSGDWNARPGIWRHAPKHRRGVAYRDKPTARKFGKSPGGVRKYRPDIRGFPERRGTDGQDRQSFPRHLGGERSRQGADINTTPGSRERERAESRQQVRERVSPSSSADRRTPDQGTRERERAESRQQVQERVSPSSSADRRTPDQGSRERERVESRQQVRERVSPSSSSDRRTPDQGTRKKERVESRQQVRSRTDGRTPNNAFGRVSDDGKAEANYSRRGRVSRESRQRSNESRSRAVDSEKKEERKDRGRMRR